ncbi:FAD-dependent oxidoreductase [Marmoricola sp. RAF53]|uniref:FAD-dependent oxidoreductase n=1 Tax=Marmoricola sp. RAF53 TaxID=3233059 RepID=UPI003F98B00B
MSPRPRNVAVIGSGVAGLTAAYVISADAEVTLFEADGRLGGHADTHTVPTPAGPVAIDTGFIVHNEKTYPTLLRLFAELDVPTQPSDMSMSVRSDQAHGGRGLEWAGALGPAGLFPTWRNAARPAYLRMLLEIPRFHRRARRLLATSEAEGDQTLAEFLAAGRFTAYFREHFMAPLVACVWSCDPAIALEYPARYLFSFLEHHGMLGVFGSPQWRTVTGGSQVYVDRVAGTLRARGGTVLLDTKVTSLAETADGVEITDGNGVVHRFDAVVVATHPDQALGILAEPTDLQRELLTAMPYSQNTAQLHTDSTVMPRHRRAWASWNQWDRPGERAVTVTYDMTRLMRLPVAEDGTRYFVTLGAADLVDPDQVIAHRDYAHPIYNPTSVAAQRRLPEIDSGRLVFAGAWHGWGFHEDGAWSGARAAERLGFSWPTAPDRARRDDDVTTPRIYDSVVRHTRRTPLKHRFRNRTHLWLVDLDALPDHGVLARFEARDHLGDPARPIRENVEAFLAGEGIRVTGGRILMAANARALGYCFNPISVFWCFDAAGDLAATVVEVHNTYGDRHAYLVHPDEAGRARVAKQMYVSPFHGVDGHYELVVPVPGDDLTICVRLITAAGEVFDASLRGTASASGPLRSAPAAIRGAVLIRMHGVWLWARRLRVRPRPPHAQPEIQEGVR